MTELIVRIFLRVPRFRKCAVGLLAYEIRQRTVDERKKRNEERRARRREERKHRKYCIDCALFKTALCNSRNTRGWCRKFEEK